MWGGGRGWKNIRLVFFGDFWVLGGSLLFWRGAGGGAGLGRVRAGGDAPRGCTPDWRTSAPSTDRGRVSRRGSRARRSAGLFGVWGKTRPSFRGSSSSTRREGSRAGSRATRRTVLPRRSRGMRGGRTGGVEVRGGEGAVEILLGGGASPLRTPGAVPSTFARARRGRTPVFRSAQLAPDEWTRGFELAGPVSTGRPRDESQASPDERTPGNKPDTSKLTGYEFFGTPARRVFGPVSAARLEPTRRGERRVAMAARDGHDAPDGA